MNISDDIPPSSKPIHTRITMMATLKLKKTWPSRIACCIVFKCYSSYNTTPRNRWWFPSHLDRKYAKVNNSVLCLSQGLFNVQIIGLHPPSLFGYPPGSSNSEFTPENIPNPKSGKACLPFPSIFQRRLLLNFGRVIFQGGSSWHPGTPKNVGNPDTQRQWLVGRRAAQSVVLATMLMETWLTPGLLTHRHGKPPHGFPGTVFSQNGRCFSWRFVGLTGEWPWKIWDKKWLD